MSKGWRKIRLGNEIELRTGYPFQSSGYTDDDNDIKLLRGDNIVQGTLRWENAKRWPKAEISNYEEFLLNEGDVILAMDRPWIDAGLKFSKISTADLPCLQVQRTARLRGGKNLSTAYLKYIIASDSFAKYVQLINTGSNVPHISSQQIKDFPVSVPTIEEQEKIAKILSDLDSKIELNNKINAELEAMSKTIYDYWFVQFDFPNAKGKPYKSSGGKMVWNDELKREIPEGWVVKSLFDVCNVQYGFPFSTTFFNEDGIGLPVIRIRDILENSITNYSTETDIDNKYLIKKGDLLIGMDGNFHINYWSVEGCYLNQRVVKLSETILPNIYLRHQVEPFIKLREQSVSRTTVGHLSDKDLKAIRVLVPSKEIIKVIQDLFNSSLNKIIQNKNENQQLASLRDWLLPMLMNGQVKVKN
jgi:type I restriction enzyme S subunit